MAISTEQLLRLLRRGYIITTFYRLSTQATFQSSVRIPESYLLVSPKGEECVLSAIEFQSITHLLTEHDIWEEIIGSTLYGGGLWSLKKIPSPLMNHSDPLPLSLQAISALSSNSSVSRIYLSYLSTTDSAKAHMINITI